MNTISTVLLSLLFFTTISCTSALRSKGFDPWSYYHMDKNKIASVLGSPQKTIFLTDDHKLRFQQRHRWIDLSDLAPASWCEIRKINGPFRSIKTDELEALLWATCTLGLAELYMFPRELVTRHQQKSEERTFIFLYGEDDCLIYPFEDTPSKEMVVEPNKRECGKGGRNSIDETRRITPFPAPHHRRYALTEPVNFHPIKTRLTL